jgi:hypothetical protein
MPENLYAHLLRWDVISRVRPLLDSGHYFLRPDFRIDRLRRLDHDATWLFTRHAGRDCHLFHKIFWTYYGLIHSRCRSCWKIEVLPRTVAELFRLNEVMHELGLAAKCGLLEPSSDGRPEYRGYFYLDSRAEAEAAYARVGAAMKRELGDETPVLLRRACPEFRTQLEAGPRIPVPAEQEELERILGEVFVGEVSGRRQSRHLKAHVMRAWIKAAYSHGDETYKAFTGGRDLFAFAADRPGDALLPSPGPARPRPAFSEEPRHGSV